MKAAHSMFTPLPTLMLLAVYLTMFALAPAHAQGDAFSIEVAVSERSESEQQEAYMAALRRVLLTNSGDKTILNRDLIRQALKQPQDYVQAFSFRRPPLGTIISTDTPITRKVQQTGQATQLMLVSFDRTLVNQLISDSAPANADKGDNAEPEQSQPITSALLWLLIRDEGRDILISDPLAAKVQTRAREIAGAAGISLAYPIGDDEDLKWFVADELGAQVPSAENLAAARLRYAQDTVLIGTLSRLPAGGWQGSWARLTADEQAQIEFETPTLDQGLQQGLGTLGSVAEIDTSYRYGGSANSDTEGLVWVGSLDSTEDYARMMRFFENVDSVATVYPKEIQATSMVFSIVPRSALVDIESLVFDVSWLQRTAPPLSDDAGSLMRNADLALQYTR